MTNTDSQSNSVNSAPESSGPRAAIAPPSPDQSAIEWVRAGPDQSAVINASVVGNAIPAARPPSTRAANRTPIDGARAASRHAGIESAIPPTSIRLRP